VVVDGREVAVGDAAPCSGATLVGVGVTDGSAGDGAAGEAGTTGLVDAAAGTVVTTVTTGA
jgi:hypothetical protein